MLVVPRAQHLLAIERRRLGVDAQSTVDAAHAATRTPRPDRPSAPRDEDAGRPRTARAGTGAASARVRRHPSLPPRPDRRPALRDLAPARPGRGRRAVP